ncbi:hypothetical protein B5V03_02425 [Bradyrhizobium betae]|uniref:Uncharacterized protein n=1 Tax=Bradyrhizobium betae TaxID=244734 RepID=A0A4Q1VS42_9BRAD|nr:hypothetical protein B5V03_02425 [Bradyrhizobium betae]
MGLSTVAGLPTYALRKRLSERRKCLCSSARMVAATDDAANGLAIEAELLSEDRQRQTRGAAFVVAGADALVALRDVRVAGLAWTGCHAGISVGSLKFI